MKGDKETGALAVLCTFPSAAVAATIGRALVSAGHAACINIVPGVRSIYRWEGEICDDAEALAVVKTTAERFEALKANLLSAHPYDCPEVIALPIRAGHDAYLDWIKQCCS